MEYIGKFIRVACVLIIVGNVHCESIQELLSRLSEKFDKIDQSYEKRFDASINKINERLDKIENVLGINDQDLEGTRKGKVIWADIQNTKHRLVKAFKNQKQHLNKVVSEYEGRFEELKQGVKDLMSEMNNKVVDNTQKVNETLLQNSNNIKESLNHLETKTDGQFREVSSKIDIISDDNTMKNKDMALYKQTIDNRFITLENKQSSTARDISTMSGRISLLHETKVAFRVYLTSTKKYSDGQTIVFDGEMYNHGNGYSTSTGNFTVPKSGTYLFSLSVEGTQNLRAYALIVSYQGASTVYRGQAFSDKSDDVTASMTIVFYFNKGDHVWVESSGNSEFFTYRTAFMGVLLD